VTEVRQAPDGRTALRIPATVDDLGKGDCDWLEVGWPDGMLTVTLLTHVEVADWTPLVPQDGATS